MPHLFFPIIKTSLEVYAFHPEESVKTGSVFHTRAYIELSPEHQEIMRVFLQATKGCPISQRQIGWLDAAEAGPGLSRHERQLRVARGLTRGWSTFCLHMGIE
ncbi:hypothetical protein RRG08_064065 [Elysia crispata]|uniref:Uncharacterized protein n=1 Tax=Elysia crispata TaxID=231223 RepID=A0AAE0YF92_9GAST|nr:hypothetical protein RRG08_064065 [Elysia crispata]